MLLVGLTGGIGSGKTYVATLSTNCGDFEITLDPGSGPTQQYVEDCGVCCQPWTVNVQYREDGGADVSVMALDE